MYKILWIDDEIEQLESIILLLEQRDYKVTGVSNCDDACAILKEDSFDVILVDQMMPGKDGLTTVREVKKIRENVPIVMITKSEDESIVDKAYSQGVTDFLVKPIKYQQIVSTCKRILEREKMIKGLLPENYTKFYNEATDKTDSLIMRQDAASFEEWVKLYIDITKWAMVLKDEKDLLSLHNSLVTETERSFGSFIERNYETWVSEEEGPVLSVDVVSRFLIPEAIKNEKVYFLILDCLRLDQWFSIKPFLEDYYEIKEQYYYSILPTATPYSRNAIYSGLFPSEIKEKYPEWWSLEANKYEKELFYSQMENMKIKGNIVHCRVRNIKEEQGLKKRIIESKDAKIVSIVVNFLDYLVHAKQESAILEELAPDVAGLRALTKLWFAQSGIYEVLKFISHSRQTSLKAPVILTTDHGALLTTKPTIIQGGKALSSNLRYKYGPALRCDKRCALFLDEPSKFKLPEATRYGIAKEDYYFIYPTHPQEYEKRYKYTFQHGGISMQEMILPCITLIPK